MTGPETGKVPGSMNHVDVPGRGVDRLRDDDVAAMAPSNDAGSSEIKVDLRAMWSAVYRNRYLLLVIMSLAVVAGIAVTIFTTPIYQAVASVQIDEQATRVLQNDTDVAPTMSSGDADRFLQTQLDVLRSRALADRVAQSLNLYRDERFLIAMGQEPSGGTGSATGSPVQRRRRVLSQLQANLGLELPSDSRVARITFSSPSATLSAQIANSFADNYIISNLQRKYDASAYARNFLQDKLSEAKDRLEETERASIAYARGAGLIDLGTGVGAGGDAGSSAPRSLTTSNLIQLNTALSNASTQRIAAQQRYQQALAMPVLSVPEVLGNGVIQDLVRQRATAQAEYEEERTGRQAAFPTVQRQASLIAGLTQQINALSQQVLNTLRANYTTALRQEQALRGDLGRLQGETLAEQNRSVRFNILRREVDTNRTLYDGLLQRYKEVSAAAGITANNISVVDRAETPTTPVLPRPLLNLALAILIGLALAFLLIFARETFDDSIRSADDVDTKLGVPFLGSVPKLPPDETPVAALGKPRSAFSEAHYALRSALEFATRTGLPRTMLLTSSLQAEGKSTTTYALSTSFARVGKRVLLIDGDLRNPSMHRLVGTERETGLSNLLTGQMSLSAVVQHTDVENLDFVPCGPLPPNPGELLAGGTLDAILNEATSKYDLVLIDGPPIMGLADAPMIGATVQGVIFVIEASRAHRGQAKIALRRLRAAQVNLLGVVLTKFDARQVGYGYNYGYGYAYNYSYGATEGATRRSLLDRLRRRGGGTNDQP